MKIEQVSVLNYKSFRSTGPLDFDPSINVIIGRNNSGKTALLEAISGRLDNVPHRSPVTVPRPGLDTQLNASKVEYVISISVDEFLDIAMKHGAAFSVALTDDDNPRHNPETFIDHHFQEKGHVRFSIHYRPFTDPEVSPLDQPNPSNNTKTVIVHVDPQTRRPYLSQPQNTVIGNDPGPPWIWPEIQARTYMFRAERTGLGFAVGSETPTLEPNASNLTLTLRYLQNENRPRYDRLIHLLRQIFPEITTLSFGPRGDGQESRVWFTDPDLERSDLAVPLDSCGTGIGQALAMLYIAVTADVAKTIVVDEPQTFLHPGALRKLIQILKSEQRIAHQYIMSTHTPQLISDSAPATFCVVTRDDYESSAEMIASSDVNRCSLLLTDIGVRMSDVLTAERIMWVEGPTEASAFPIILNDSLKFGHPASSLLGTSILPLSSTGDLEGKSMEAAARIFEAMSRGVSFLPPALAFIIDSELRTDEQKDRIERTFNRRVHWLKRRMYENYLLHPEALSKLILNFPDTPQADATPEAIQQRLQELLDSSDFYHGQAPKLHDDRLRMVHGANVLDKLVRDTMGPDKGYNYKTQKVSFGAELTKYILEIQPSALQEVYDLLASALNESSANGETSSIA